MKEGGGVPYVRYNFQRDASTASAWKLGRMGISKKTCVLFVSDEGDRSSFFIGFNERFADSRH